MPTYVDDELVPPTPEQAEYLRKQGHPYAKLSVTLPENAAASQLTEQVPAAKITTSMEEFETESRRILMLYVPAIESNLRPHHRAFIARNRVRSPSARYRVLSQLRKYDLSNVSGIEARFNREDDDVTEGKLKEIEKAAGIDE
jgi:hypothetical protein